MKGSIWKIPIQYPIEDPIPALATAPVLVKLHGKTLEEPVMTLKIAAHTKMEQFCRKICAWKNLDYEAHSLDLGDIENLKPVEMNRRAVYYFNPNSPTEVYITNKAKVYSSDSVKNGEEEIIISKCIEERYLHLTSSIIMAAKKDIIFELISDVNFEDSKFSNVIFLTYRSFASTDEFLTHLLLKFYSKLSENPTEEEIATFEKFKVSSQLKYQKLIRILRVLHGWIEHHWHDFGLSNQLRVILGTFLNLIGQSENSECAAIASGLSFVADIQNQWFEDLLGTHSAEEKRQKQIDSMFEELEIDDIGQQLCIHNSELFRNIHSIEFLNEIWKKPGDESSPSFKFFVERFDKESYWVATELLGYKDPKKRVNALKKFIMLVKVIICD